MIKTTMALACVAVLCGCGDTPGPEEGEPERESVFDPLTKTLDRAEAVEDTIQERSEELRRRVEEAEGR